MTDRINTESEIIDIEDLETDFMTLRIGEEIPRLKIKQIRKMINKSKQDNLPGVDYKFIIETRDKKLLMVNSWVLWKKISAVLRKAGKIDVDLELRHSGLEDYTIKVL